MLNILYSWWQNCTCPEKGRIRSHTSYIQCIKNLPVSMFWKAVSTFVESSADVSINDKPFFSGWGRVKCKGIILISAHPQLQCIYIHEYSIYMYMYTVHVYIYIYTTLCSISLSPLPLYTHTLSSQLHNTCGSNIGIHDYTCTVYYSISLRTVLITHADCRKLTYSYYMYYMYMYACFIHSRYTLYV